MRRKDRELTDMGEIMEIVARENVCCVAFCDETYPYIIPINYGAQMEDGKPVLYFHGAAEGTKLERIKANPHVSFAIISNEQVHVHVDAACSSTESFESVCGNGCAEILTGIEERKKGLAVIMNHIGRPQGASFDENSFPDAAVKATAVWKITVDTITGKRHE